MFYFKITVRSRNGDTKRSTNLFRECLHPDDIGDIVSAKFGNTHGITSVGVTKISQAAYVRATRSD